MKNSAFIFFIVHLLPLYLESQTANMLLYFYIPIIISFFLEFFESKL